MPRPSMLDDLRVKSTRASLPRLMTPSWVAHEKGILKETVIRAINFGWLPAVALYGADGAITTFGITEEDALAWVPPSQETVTERRRRKDRRKAAVA